MANDYGAEDLEQLWLEAMGKYKAWTGNDLEVSRLEKIEDMKSRISSMLIVGRNSDVIRASMSRLIDLGDVVSDAVSSVRSLSFSLKVRNR